MFPALSKRIGSPAAEPFIFGVNHRLEVGAAAPCTGTTSASQSHNIDAPPLLVLQPLPVQRTLGDHFCAPAAAAVSLLASTQPSVDVAAIACRLVCAAVKFCASPKTAKVPV